MSIKKQISIEIEVDEENSKNCSPLCKYRDQIANNAIVKTCKLFFEILEMNDIPSIARCQQCIEEFGLEQDSVQYSFAYKIRLQTSQVLEGVIGPFDATNENDAYIKVTEFLQKTSGYYETIYLKVKED